MLDIINEIEPVDSAVYQACIDRFNDVAKPIGSLGQLESELARIGAMQRTAHIDISKKCLMLYCADNGVVAQGVAQCGQEVTTAIAQSVHRHASSVCVMADCVPADVFLVDVGMVDTVEGVEAHKTMCGTNDMTQGPAMGYDDAVYAINVGIDQARRRVAEGYNLIATGEAGIGNTTSTAAVASVLLACSPHMITGKGSGLSDEGLARKIAAIETAIALSKPDSSDPIDVIAKVGGFDIAAMCGTFLGGAACHVPVLVDGVISSVAALAACRLAPITRDYLVPSHMSAEPAAKMIVEELAMHPVIEAGMHLGEGCGAIAMMPLLDMSHAVYARAANFSDISVEAYDRDIACI